MRIQRITTTPIFGAKNSKTTNINHKSQQHTNPMKNGLSTAGTWFGFGLGFDFLSRKLQFSKSPMKNSLAINGILGTGAGIYIGVQDKLQKNKKD